MSNSFGLSLVKSSNFTKNRRTWQQFKKIIKQYIVLL